MNASRTAREAVGELLTGAAAALVGVAFAVLVSAATRLPVEAALLAGALACGGRRLWGQLGALGASLLAGLALGGHDAGTLSAALGAGWLAAFGAFACSEPWGMGHLKAAGRFIAAGATVLLAGQWLGWSPRGPLMGPVLGAAGIVLLTIVIVEFGRNVRAASKSRQPSRRRRPAAQTA